MMIRKSVCMFECLCVFRHHLLNVANAISFCFTVITETDMGAHTHMHTHTYQKEIIINMKVSTPRKIAYRDGSILSSLR